MTIEREVTIAGQTYPVILSDENEALQAAKAAGRAIVGLWRENEEKQPADYSSCLYLITDPEDADETFLERVVRRHLALPWLIAETDRLIIREFSQDDPLEPASAEDADGTFSDWNKREEYRKHQYRFAECGLWALERRADGVLVGKAGLTELDKIRLCTKRSNTASRILAKKMGFIQVPSSCKDSIVFCMQKGYNSLYTK